MAFIRHEQCQNKLKRNGRRRRYRTRPQQHTREVKITGKTGNPVHGMSRDITRSILSTCLVRPSHYNENQLCCLSLMTNHAPSDGCLKSSLYFAAT
jgi:FtsZ-interacting cell division protein YlmF